MIRYISSLHRYKSRKRGWMAWMVPENFRIENRILVEIVVTFPINQQSCQVIDLCWAATDTCHLIHGICLKHRETFGQSTSYVRFSTDTYQGVLRSTTPSAAGAIPVQITTGRPVARGEEKIGSTTPMPMSAGSPSTMYSFLPAEIPQNSMAVHQRLQISEILPHLQRFHVGR